MRGRRAKQQFQIMPAPPSPWRPCARKTQTLRARPAARQSHKPPNRARCQVSRPSDRPFTTHRLTSLPFSAAARAPFCVLHQSVERMASRLMRDARTRQPDEQSCAYSDDDLDQHGRRNPQRVLPGLGSPAALLSCASARLPALAPRRSQAVACAPIFRRGRLRQH
jgi:hypothetical protein